MSQSTFRSASKFATSSVDLARLTLLLQNGHHRGVLMEIGSTVERDRQVPLLGGLRTTINSEPSFPEPTSTSRSVAVCRSKPSPHHLVPVKDLIRQLSQHPTESVVHMARRLQGIHRWSEEDKVIIQERLTASSLKSWARSRRFYLSSNLPKTCSDFSVVCNSLWTESTLHLKRRTESYRSKFHGLLIHFSVITNILISFLFLY